MISEIICEILSYVLRAPGVVYIDYLLFFIKKKDVPLAKKLVQKVLRFLGIKEEADKSEYGQRLTFLGKDFILNRDSMCISNPPQKIAELSEAFDTFEECPSFKTAQQVLGRIQFLFWGASRGLLRTSLSARGGVTPALR